MTTIKTVRPKVGPEARVLRQLLQDLGGTLVGRHSELRELEPFVEALAEEADVVEALLPDQPYLIRDRADAAQRGDCLVIRWVAPLPQAMQQVAARVRFPAQDPLDGRNVVRDDRYCQSGKAKQNWQ